MDSREGMMTPACVVPRTAFYCPTVYRSNFGGQTPTLPSSNFLLQFLVAFKKVLADNRKKYNFRTTVIYNCY